jgi:Ala-tRNA(Pro) deacylase
MQAMLNTRPGSVSPMGLLFDGAADVRLLVDSALWAQKELAFHPCDNTATLAMSSKDFFEIFLPAVGKKAEPVEIHDFLSDGE